MRNLFCFILLVGILGCGGAQQEPQNANPVQPESKYRRLLSKYKDKTFDTLRVYSPEDLDGAYKGVQLDSLDAILFPADIARLHFGDPPGLFAVYKFTIDQNRLGLITRTPSDFVPSSIKLFFFDKAKDSITHYIELAESWGDAGDVWIKDAWIFRNARQEVESFIMIQEMHYNSVEDENDTTVQKSDYYFHLDVSKGGDTLSRDEKELSRQFAHLVDKARR